MNTYQKEALEFAHHIMSLDYRVFMAESGTYGFITDEKEERVLSFEFSLTGLLSGNYEPTHSSGSGWRMDTTPDQLKTKEDVHRALYAHPPIWTGFTGNLRTMKSFLEIYQKSSKFHEL